MPPAAMLAPVHTGGRAVALALCTGCALSITTGKLWLAEAPRLDMHGGLFAHGSCFRKVVTHTQR